MKKFLLFALAIIATTAVMAETKTVKFDFSDPTVYGFAKPEASGETVLGDKAITSGDISIKATANGATAVRFFCSSSGAVTFRLSSGCAIAVSTANGNITKIVLDGSNIGTANITELTADGVWEGSAASVTLTCLASTVTMKTMEVTYETSEGGQGGGGTTGEKESYWAASYDSETNTGVATSDWILANDSTHLDQATTVTINTKNVTMVAVSGPISHSINVNEGADKSATDPGFSKYYENYWKVDKKNDWKNAKQEVEAHGFIQGYGNPCASQTHTPVYSDDKGKWTVSQVFNYYLPDGSAGMPTNGSYFKFTAKTDGAMAIWAYILKGSRPLYIVDEDTKCALDTTQYYVEGCANNHKAEDGTLLYTRMYHGTQIVTQPNAADPTVTDTLGYEPSYVIMDAVQKANQNIWGWIKFNMTANKTYWVFCKNTQLGLSGFEFTPSTGDGIKETVADTPVKADNRIFNLAGQQVDASYKGVVIQNGKKYMKR